MKLDNHSHAATRSGDRVFLILSILIVLVAASLRIYHVAQRSLWLDEAIAANISRGTLAQTLTLTRGLHSAPIVDPFMLYVVERFSTGPLAVRAPSLLASILAVILMLCFAGIPSIGRNTAALAALMLSVSAAQIRYSQEVREYSLSVLHAGVLLYVFLSYISKKETENSPVPLYLALFFAPLVQYGLILFCLGILAALFVLAFTESKPIGRIVQIMIASGFLATGGLISAFLTLRYQYGDDTWYLNNYLLAPGSSILRFAAWNTHHLITFLLPGLAAAAISVIAILFSLADSFRARIVSPLTILACTSCGIVLAGSLLRLYPYGGIRQCLFLAPLLCLFASASLVHLADRIPARASVLALAAIAGLVVISGVLQIRLLKPYAEIENIQPVLLSLRGHIQPGDAVYIYPPAVYAVDYYVRPRDPRFIYGDYHQQAPQDYVPQLMGGLNPEANRLWIVFSHVFRDEDQRILHDLSSDWNIVLVRSVTGSSLYLATRRPVVLDVVSSASGNATIEAFKTAPAADHTHDSFWDWNIRNARPSVR